MKYMILAAAMLLTGIAHPMSDVTDSSYVRIRFGSLADTSRLLLSDELASPHRMKAQPQFGFNYWATDTAIGVLARYTPDDDSLWVSPKFNRAQCDSTFVHAGSIYLCRMLEEIHRSRMSHQQEKQP